MSAYLLFVEGASPNTANDLPNQLGIGQIVGRGEPGLLWVHCQAGPGGKPGMLGGWCVHAETPTFNPAKQEWRRAPSENFWVGQWRDRPLTPEDIVRQNVGAVCYSVPLEDGQKWLIPAARWLPHLWTMNKELKRIRVPVAEYVEFCEQADVVFQAFVKNAAGGQFEIECEWEFVCRAIEINYRLAPEIIATLKLIGDRTGSSILTAVIEWEGITKVVQEKKNAELATTDATPPT